LIWGLLVIGVLFCLLGAFWVFLKDVSPTFTEFATGIATNPVSWFAILAVSVCAALLIQVKSTRLIPVRGHAEGDNNKEVQLLEQKITDLTYFHRGMIDSLNSELASIKKQISVDFPNASTVADAFKSLDDAIKSKVKRIEEGNTVLLARLKADNLDLKHLLYFALLQATEQLLAYLVATAPKKVKEASVLTDEFYERNTEFLKHVSMKLSGTHRESSYRNIMASGEAEADRLLKDIPADQWPGSGHPVDIRRYCIAAHQVKLLFDYLEFELREVREQLRNSRSTLSDRITARDKI
jgi:uncharacterized protein YdcH (DUF465 family)